MTKDDANKKVGNERLSIVLLIMNSDVVKGFKTFSQSHFSRDNCGSKL
jgi:hypothetical protein